MAAPSSATHITASRFQLSNGLASHKKLDKKKASVYALLRGGIEGRLPVGAALEGSRKLLGIRRSLRKGDGETEAMEKAGDVASTFNQVSPVRPTSHLSAG